MLAKEDSEIGQASNKESLRKGGIKGELRLLFWLCLIRNVYSISDIRVDGSSNQLGIRIWSSDWARDKIFGVFILDRCVVPK